MTTRSLDIVLPPAFSGADYIQTFVATAIDESVDPPVEVEVDISTATITVNVEDEHGSERWTGTIGNGVELTGNDGEYTVWIPKASMGGLMPGRYNIGALLANGTVTVQHFRGTLPVLDGYAT